MDLPEICHIILNQLNIAEINNLYLVNHYYQQQINTKFLCERFEYKIFDNYGDFIRNYKYNILYFLRSINRWCNIIPAFSNYINNSYKNIDEYIILVSDIINNYNNDIKDRLTAKVQAYNYYMNMYVPYNQITIITKNLNGAGYLYKHKLEAFNKLIITGSDISVKDICMIIKTKLGLMDRKLKTFEDNGNLIIEEI